jgi:hypothetical protein
MALKTNWQKMQDATCARRYARWDWIRGWEKRRVQARKALYMMGFKVNYPFRKR